MPDRATHDAAITVYFPARYTEKDIEPFRLRFPEIHCALNARCFSIEVMLDDIPMEELKAVFAWIESNLGKEDSMLETA